MVCGLSCGLSFQRWAVPSPGRAIAIVPGHSRPGPTRTEWRTPPKRAPSRSGQAGTVHDRPDTRQLTDRITLSNREVSENARRAVMIGNPTANAITATGPEMAIWVPVSRQLC
jgi:hypothetical protein